MNRSTFNWQSDDDGCKQKQNNSGDGGNIHKKRRVSLASYE